jgi:hypothetical protein
MERPNKIQCPHKPEELLGQPIGMYHCPICGDMVVAGFKHHPKIIKIKKEVNK